MDTLYQMVLLIWMYHRKDISVLSFFFFAGEIKFVWLLFSVLNVYTFL